MSNIADLIDRRGETVNLYRRTELGMDEYGRPEYTWSLQASEKAIVHPVGYTTGVGEVALEAGEMVLGYHVGYFKASSIIQRNDQVEWSGVRFDVKAVRIHRVGGATQFKEAVMERLIE